MNIVLKALTGFYKIIRLAISNFIDDNAVQFGASLSFYTLFAAAPIIIIVISLAGIFYGTEAVQGKIYGQINGLVGVGAAIQVQEIIKNIETSEQGTIGALIGIIILLVAATGVFTEIQYSINFIWSIKAKPKRGWIKILKNRLLSFSLIIGLGFILLITLVISAFLDLLNERLLSHFPGDNVALLNLFNSAIIFAVTTCLFTTIFKVLPDARIKWRDSFVGACFTSSLFLVGKYLISFYLAHSIMTTNFGGAASMVIILLWVYYSSNILFFGAEFTKTYALQYGSGIVPDETAVFIIKQEAKEINVASVKL
ncbi:MAG: YihY/virulence factor BrkB family protein [Bacteroidota bacterium]